MCSVSSCRPEHFGIDFFHELAAGGELLRVEEDALCLVSQLLVLDLSLQVHHIALLSEVLRRFFQLQVCHLGDLADSKLILLAIGSSHLPLLVMLHRGTHLVSSLLQFDYLVARHHIMEELIRPILLVFEPLHLAELLFLVHGVAEVRDVLVSVHFELGLRDVLWAVEDIEDLGIPVSYALVVQGQVSVALGCHGVELGLLLLELLLLLEDVCLLLQLVVFYLSEKLVVQVYLLIFIPVFLMTNGYIQHLIIVAILCEDFCVNCAVVEVSRLFIVVDINFILQIQVRQEVLFVDLVGVLKLLQRLVLAPNLP